MHKFKSFAFAGLLAVSVGAAAEINLSLNPASLDMGDVALGLTATGDATVGITFNGSGDLDGQANNGSVTSISVLSEAGGSFTASQACVGQTFSANSPGDTCTVEVECTPNQLDSPATANLEVQFERNNGSAADVETTALSCRATAPGPGGSSTAVPVMGGLGLGIMGLAISVIAMFGLSRRK